MRQSRSWRWDEASGWSYYFVILMPDEVSRSLEMSSHKWSLLLQRAHIPYIGNGAVTELPEPIVSVSWMVFHSDWCLFCCVWFLKSWYFLFNSVAILNTVLLYYHLQQPLSNSWDVDLAAISSFDILFIIVFKFWNFCFELLLNLKCLYLVMMPLANSSKFTSNI